MKDLPDGAELERLRVRHGRSQVIEDDPRLGWLAGHGDHAMAYSTLQPAMHHFLVDEAGYLSFRPQGRHHVVLGDPVGPAAGYSALFAAFTDHCAREGRQILVVQASAAAADAVAGLGFARHYFGVESAVALADRDAGPFLQGKNMSYLRRACNQARRAGVVVREIAGDPGEQRDRRELHSGDDRSRTREVSEQWRRSRGRDTIDLLIRPFSPGAELDVRTFAGFVGDQMIAFVTFDPLYRDGAIIGYYQQHMRYGDGAPNGAISLITVRALEQFRAEGRQVLDLGLSPFAGIDTHAAGERSMFIRVARRLYDLSNNPRRGGDHYGFRGNYFQKSRYRGHETPVFLLEYPPSRTGSLAILARATRLHTGFSPAGPGRGPTPTATTRPGAARGEATTLPNGLTLEHLNRYETDTLYREIFAEQIYLHHGIEIADGDLILDIGGNIGMLALFVKHRCPGARVVAVEPVPALCRLLRRNLARYGESVRVLPWALADRDGTAVVTFYPGYSLMSGLHADPDRDHETLAAGIRDWLHGSLSARGEDAAISERAVAAILGDKLDDPSQHPCPVRTLSTLLRDLAIDQVDLLAIDTEGSELDIFRGVARDDWPRIRQVVVEVHRAEMVETAASLLAEVGFTVAVGRDRQAAGMEQRRQRVHLYARRP